MSAKRNARAVLVDDLPFEAPAGHFKFYAFPGESEPAGILYGCPCGCGAVHGAAFRRHQDGRSVWTWDGNREAPSVNPSLGLHPKAADGSYHWHGHLKAGVFEEC